MNQPLFDKETNSKVKKNLLWFGIFSIIMLFAGLTSAYFVSKGSEFWVQFTMPTAFKISTALVVISSLVLIVVGIVVKKNNQGLLKLLLGVAVILGIGFSWFQYKGWTEMLNRGLALRSNIINQDGKYGQYYTILYQNKEIIFDGYDLLFEGQPINNELQKKLDDFCKKLMEGSNTRVQNKVFDIPNYGAEFVLKYENQLITYSNGELFYGAQPLDAVLKGRLYRFSESLLSRRGDFMVVGRYGIDFKISYKGRPVSYENRNFFIDGEPIKAIQLSELNGQQNKSAQYTLIFVLVHVTHLLFGLVALIVIWIRSILGKYSADNYLGIQLGTIYWHFLGILWIYLYVFLILFH